MLTIVVGCNSNTSSTENEAVCLEETQEVLVGEIGGNSQINHILFESEISLKHYEEIAQARNFTSKEVKELSTTAREISFQTQELLKDPSLTEKQSAKITELHHRWMAVVHHNLTKSGSKPMMVFDVSNVVGTVKNEDGSQPKIP